ncbi:MAG TPA: futalosine hydrolase [Chitinophagaceae bacterium]|nr:futalosine hydrolase [Chitinophagaceae bacterium]
MELLLTAATALEIEPVCHWLGREEQPGVYLHGDHRIRVLISGAGILRTTYHLTRWLMDYPCDLAIQAGIAGSFREEFLPGTVFAVEKEILGDTGAGDGPVFRDLFDIGLAGKNDPPFRDGMLINPLGRVAGPWEPTGLDWAKGITVNKVTGDPQTVRNLVEKYDPDLETMEGAAFHFVCLLKPVPFLQVRAISNYAGHRNRESWDIPIACRNLHQALIPILENPGGLDLT